MRRHPAHLSLRGWSLIEAMTAIVVVAILCMLAIPPFQQMQARRLVEGQAEQLRSSLMLARSEAFARNTSVLVSFHPGSTPACYVLQTGKPSDCTCAESGAAKCVNGATEIKTIVLPKQHSLTMATNITSLTFSPVRGTSSMGTISLTAGDRQTISVVVNKTGRIRLCPSKPPCPD